MQKSREPVEKERGKKKKGEREVEMEREGGEGERERERERERHERHSWNGLCSFVGGAKQNEGERRGKKRGD